MHARLFLLGSSLVVAGAGCDPSASPAAADADRTPQALGKADAVAGSCDHDGELSCGGKSPDTCWCDEACGYFGDCCADAHELCGVDQCDLTVDRCPLGSHCAATDSGLDCCNAEHGPGTFDCPDGWRLAPNHAGAAFCLREDLTVGPNVTSRCEGLDAGVLGYLDPAATSCPADATAVQTAEGLECRFDVALPVAGAVAYCDYVADGYLGFAWTACPAPLGFELGEGDEQRCVGRPSSLPVGVQAWCNTVEDGYFGYTWLLADDPTHACPGGTRQMDDGMGRAYCWVEDYQVPGLARPYCDAEAGYFGFEWNASC